MSGDNGKTPEEELADMDLDDVDEMQVITIIRDHRSFRVETSEMTADAALACMVRAMFYQCMREYDELDDDEPEEGECGA